jgi:hypothetical protein
VNHRGSISSAKHWGHRHTGAHLSTNFEQTLRRHDAGRAADCWHPLGGGGVGASPLTRIHTATLA